MEGQIGLGGLQCQDILCIYVECSWCQLRSYSPFGGTRLSVTGSKLLEQTPGAKLLACRRIGHSSQLVGTRSKFHLNSMVCEKMAVKIPGFHLWQVNCGLVLDGPHTTLHLYWGLPMSPRPNTCMDPMTVP
jgi:hypothetical protein